MRLSLFFLPLTIIFALIAAVASAGWYIVKQGDTLSAIADGFHVSLQALEAANPGVTPDRIFPGQAIWIP
uniref:Chitin-binding LysM effector n=1 Tax=Rhizophagus irregularis TaxID=588596 RepID=A0A5P8I3J9_9GLOM|nr:chitin-binding LysM effector [Rhizophagus irregularis]